MKPLSQISPYLRSHLRYPEDLFNDQAQAYAQVHITQPSVFYNGSDLFSIAQESLNGTNQSTTAYYVEMTLPGTSSPQFVLLQTFSPGGQRWWCYRQQHDRLACGTVRLHDHR